MRTTGRVVTGRLVQGDDGVWREVKPARQRRPKTPMEKELDRRFRAIERAIFSERAWPTESAGAADTMRAAKSLFRFLIDPRLHR